MHRQAAIPVVYVWLMDVYRYTVDSVGIIWGRTLPFTTSNKAIKVFRHALALDEVSRTTSSRS